MSILNNSLLLGAPAGATAYTIQRSLRFNPSDSARLSRTPTSAGNRRTWTFSVWVKQSSADNFNEVLTVGSNNFALMFNKDISNGISLYEFNGSTVTHQLNSTPVYRDLSAWMHLVVAYDTTQATASNRIKIYINGVQVTAFSPVSYPAQNYESYVNSTSTHYIGAETANSRYFSGYMADAHLIDGQALDPTSLGQFDTNNVWQPNAYSGTYGTNGFILDFSDNSNNTATTLGKDTSGNNNNWTPVNLSVTAGAGNDSLVDTPTSYGTGNSGGDVRGNYATLNPLNQGTLALANGNLDVAHSADQWDRVTGTIGMTSGKWYWEVVSTSLTWYYSTGIAKQGAARTNAGTSADANIWEYDNSAGLKVNATVTAYGASFGVNDIIGVAFDADNGTLTFYKNNVSQGTAFTGLTSGPYFPSIAMYRGSTEVFNFGQRPFAYTAPSGFKALCTANLPEGTIITSGTFTGNANADGPFIWLNGVPTAMTINSNAVTFGTHADKLANGFKLRTNSTSYNTSGSNTYSITTTGAKFKNARAQSNP